MARSFRFTYRLVCELAFSHTASYVNPVRRPTTREATKQATREALVLAGKKLFAKKGLDGPSLDAICEQAGFTRGAFYVHFKDRDDLLAAVMDEVGREYLDGLFSPGDAGGGDVFTL